jgi:hypothetical protein
MTLPLQPVLENYDIHHPATTTQHHHPLLPSPHHPTDPTRTSSPTGIISPNRFHHLYIIRHTLSRRYLNFTCCIDPNHQLLITPPITTHPKSCCYISITILRHPYLPLSLHRDIIHLSASIFDPPKTPLPRYISYINILLPPLSSHPY